nr:hypothetical protein [Amoebophilaceae bacterium]
LKREHRLGRNYLKRRVGDTNHALLAGMGFNLMLLLREWAGNFWALYALRPSEHLHRAQHLQPLGCVLKIRLLSHC